MTMDLFAGVPVRDYTAAVAWYERLLGAPPSFLPNDTEAVWDLAEHRSVFVEHAPERAGTARHSIFVDDLDATQARVLAAGARAFDFQPNPDHCLVYADPVGHPFCLTTWKAPVLADDVTTRDG
jgi:catechol 2,3-dioxygenase-like lactoylglutathione lyase family enzyme